MKKIIAVNASPRVGWNTDLMVQEAAKGAMEAGAEAEIIELAKLERYGGCRACYACKLEKNEGRCVFRDGLLPVLEKIREADGVILGSPIYVGDLTAGFRAMFERLIYQHATYRMDEPFVGNEPKKPVLLIVTSNAPLWDYPRAGYDRMTEFYVDELNRAIGPTKLVIADETMMTWDYEKYNWTRFDYDDRRRRRREVFPGQLREAYEAAAELFG